MNYIGAYTDLAIEYTKNLPKNDEFVKNEYKSKNINVTSFFIPYSVANEIKRKSGNYITIEFEDITEFNNREDIKKIFALELEKIIKMNNISKDDSCLIIGLGNSRSTPDSLGPMAIKEILVTSPFHDYNDKFRKTYAFSPGVMADTGIESSDLVKSIINTVYPNFIIVIDSLVSESIKKLNKVIQITDTGIFPGSGVGNTRKEISKEMYNVPVIVIGVPMVVEAVTIVDDAIKYMDNDIKVTKAMIDKVLSKNNLMVTPKEIDFIVAHLGDIVGNGINRALHKHVTKL